MKPSLNIEFESVLAARETELQKRIAMIRAQSTQLRMIPFCTFSVADIPSLDSTTKSSKEWFPPQMCFEKEHRRNPFVYIFQLADPTQKDIVLRRFEEERVINAARTKDKLALPKLPKDAFESTSDILYVGSRKTSFHDRIKGHLGNGTKSTYAMQLNKWAPTNLRLHLYLIQVDDETMTEEVEAAISAHLKPLIGKTQS